VATTLDISKWVTPTTTASSTPGVVSKSLMIDPNAPQEVRDAIRSAQQAASSLGGIGGADPAWILNTANKFYALSSPQANTTLVAPNPQPAYVEPPLPVPTAKANTVPPRVEHPPMSSSYYFGNLFFDEQVRADEEARIANEEAQKAAERERLKWEAEEAKKQPPVILPPVSSTTTPYYDNPYDNPNYNGYENVGPTNPFTYDNPYQGPVPTPGPITYGPTPDMPLLPVTTDPSIIGAIDPNTGLPYRHQPDPVPLEKKDIHPFDPFNPVSNPTIYGTGGLGGTGVDIGIPGIVSVGGLLGAGGGLLGLGGDMGGLFGGGGGGGSTGSGQGPQPIVIPPVGSQPSQPQQNDTLTVPVSNGPGVLTSITNQQQSNPVTLPPVTPNTNQNDTLTIPVANTGPGPLTNISQQNNPFTLPPIIPQAPPVDNNPTGPITLPVSPSSPPVMGPPTNPESTPPITLPPISPPPVVPPPVVPPPTTPPPSSPPPTTPPAVPTTPLPLPLDRNYYREGSQTNQDNSALLPGIFQNYQNYSGGYGQADMANFAGLLSSLGINNSQLTNFANQQTAAGNTALRTGNVADASNLGGQALGVLQGLNPNMYGALNRTNTAAVATGTPSDIQMALEQQAREGLALGSSLSADDTRRAQQAAREGWSARGLVNSTGAVAEEVLNRDSLARQRLAERQALASAVDQQGFSQRQQGFGNQVQNSLLQMQGAFNPFQTITSANTTNQGSNQQLFNQGAGFSSGSFGNQNVNNLVNPFSPYAQDVYSTNTNAANARYISQGNNAAAMAGARDAASGEIANSFLRLIGDLYGAG
jgi:hypothetical protein